MIAQSPLESPPPKAAENRKDADPEVPAVTKAVPAESADSAAPAAPAAGGQGRVLDDVTFIKEIKHSTQGAWYQYDVLLDAAIYGWSYMLDSADYMATADLINISEVTTADLGIDNTNVTASYNRHGS